MRNDILGNGHGCLTISIFLICFGDNRQILRCFISWIWRKVYVSYWKAIWVGRDLKNQTKYKNREKAKNREKIKRRAKKENTRPILSSRKLVFMLYWVQLLFEFWWRSVGRNVNTIYSETLFIFNFEVRPVTLSRLYRCFFFRTSPKQYFWTTLKQLLNSVSHWLL